MLEPYTVLDFTDARGEIGPMLLGDLGAAVIRVELPGGTSARGAGPLLDNAPEDLRSLQFLAFNRNKRSIVLDPDAPADRETLVELIRRADFIFESAPSRTLAAYGFDFADTQALNDRIVFVRLSPFGDSGPRSDYLGNDLVIAALGGPVALQGVPDRSPIRVSVPQVWRHAGVEAAAGAMVAHANMLRSGSAQFVDLSAQCAMTWTMLNAMDAAAIQGFDFERSGSTMNNGVIKVELVHPTADGYIVALPMSQVLSGCMEWMIADGIVDESYRDVDWDAYDLSIVEPDAPVTLAQGTDICRRFFANHTKHELLEFGLKKGITLAPVNTLEELLALEHMTIRDYWRVIKAPDGRSVRAAGLWCKPGKAPLSVQREAPALDQHGDEIRAELNQAPPGKSYPEPSATKELPFAGLRVADFSWVGVGPISAKYLADHGADVIRVESENRLDVLRGGGPHKDAEPGINRSQFYGDFNTSKKSITLDMKSSDAIEIAKKLIAASDVLIESFAPGAIKRMGLGYDEVKRLNPDIIMISTCLMGQTGPASAMAGYGYHAAAIAGFYEVTGWPDLSPSGPWIAYTDTIAPRFVSVLLASALDHRRRTGEGCYIDVAQIEAALHFLAPELLDFQLNGVAASRIGNRSPYAAPQGCYACAGDDNWCAIAVDTDEQWRSLAKRMQREDLLADSALATNEGRLTRHDDLDAAISEWTAAQDADAVMVGLQAAGVPAGVVQRSSDLLSDPQYQHREFYRYFDHPEMGHIPYAGHQYKILGYDNGPRGPAPMLGEHSFEVLSEIIELGDEDIGNAFASGVIN